MFGFTWKIRTGDAALLLDPRAQVQGSGTGRVPLKYMFCIVLRNKDFVLADPWTSEVLGRSLFLSSVCEYWYEQYYMVVCGVQVPDKALTLVFCGSIEGSWNMN